MGFNSGFKGLNKEDRGAWERSCPDDGKKCGNGMKIWVSRRAANLSFTLFCDVSGAGR